MLCETLEVSTAGYYAWRGRPASGKSSGALPCSCEIRAIHAEVKARYGSPPIHAELAARGQDCCVNTVAELMRHHGIVAKTAPEVPLHDGFKHGLPVAENVLDRQFNPACGQ